MSILPLGHDWALEMLAEHVIRGQERHAYLFSGPPGVGRRTLALRFAQMLNCSQPSAPGQPCGVCRACLGIEKMQHPDLFVVQAEGEGGTLKVDQVRALQHSLSLAPYEARYKLALLLRFEQANANAANALLKTLEEAPPRVILLMTADAPESLLPTIASRCEVFRLRPMPVDALAAHLEKHERLPADRAQVIAHLSGGRLGTARCLVASPEELEKRLVWLGEALELLQAPLRERFAYAARLTESKKAESKEQLHSIYLTWLLMWRDVMLCAAGSQTPLVNHGQEHALRQVSALVPLQTARALANQVEDGLRRLEANGNPRLVTEALLMDWPELHLAPRSQEGV